MEKMRRVLVVDDEPKVCKRIGKFLETKGFEVSHGHDGFDAIKKCQSFHPHIIIMDIKMPKMDGVECLIKLKKMEPDIEVIMVSAIKELNTAISCMHDGAFGYLTKPLDLENILIELNRALHHRKLVLENREYSEHLEDLVRKRTAELEKANKQLLQADKMASMGQLAAGVAHEINNPVGFVHSNLNSLGDYINDLKKLLEKYDALEKESMNSDNEKISRMVKDLESYKNEIDLGFLLDDIAKLLHESKDGSNRLIRIIRDLKDFSRADQGEITDFNINDGIESTLNIIRNEIKYKAKVVKELGPIPSIQCNPHQLNQVFLNILVNAAQSIKEKGEVRIATKLVKPEEETGKGRQDYIELKISDTGTGISPENLSRIFDPFFTTKGVGKGTGLGLSISQRIIQEHKGEIKVESRVGEGTQFRIILPVGDLG